MYEGAPTHVTAFFALTPKIAIFALLLRFSLYTCYDLIESARDIIILSALLSFSVATVAAIGQYKIKRLFAYSSIAHVGYLLMGLGAASTEATESTLIYLIIYALTALNV